MKNSLKRSPQKIGRGLTSSLLSAASNVLSKIPIGNVINTAIDALPIELHLPGGYQYCGPGTKLEKRLLRGDEGINKLDQACKAHDIAYSKHSDQFNRSIADKVLAEKAWKRVKAIDASLGERAAALAVTGAMRAETIIGGGGKKGKKRRSVKKGGNIRKKKKVAHKKKKRPSHRYGQW